MSRELELLADLARRSAAVAGEPPGEAELRRLGQAWRRRQRRTMGVLGVGLLAAGAAALALYLSPGRAGAPLRYDLEGDVAFGNRHIDVRGPGARLAFSDGTRLELAHATRATLAAIDASGARVRLDRGQAHAAVQHTGHAHWAIDAGPFTIQVVGTTFDVSWSPDDEVLEVALAEGAVLVEGPLPQLPLSVRAGQRLTVRARDPQLRIAPLSAAASPPAAPAGSTVAAISGSAPPPPERGRARRRAATPAEGDVRSRISLGVPSRLRSRDL